MDKNSARKRAAQYQLVVNRETRQRTRHFAQNGQNDDAPVARALHNLGRFNDRDALIA